MNAMEKVAWAELLVCITALAAVGVLVPWLGDRTQGGFGLLGLLGFVVLFLRRCGNQVITDERSSGWRPGLAWGPPGSRCSWF